MDGGGNKKITDQTKYNGARRKAQNAQNRHKPQLPFAEREKPKIFLIFSGNSAVTFVNSRADCGQTNQKQKDCAERQREKNLRDGFLNLAVAVCDPFGHQNIKCRKSQPDIKYSDADGNTTLRDSLPFIARVIDIRRAAQDVPKSVTDCASDKNHQQNSPEIEHRNPRQCAGRVG